MRIRYEKAGEPGIERSVRVFQHPTNGGQFRVYLNVNENKAVIFDEVAGLNAVELEAKSYQMMLKQVKKQLEALGIEIGVREHRNKPPEGNNV